MLVYLVWYDNGEMYGERERWTGGLYTTKSEAEKEVEDLNYVKDATSERYNNSNYVERQNKLVDTSDTGLIEFEDQDYAYIEEIEILEKYVRDDW